LAGADAGNYVLSDTTAATEADIEPAPITVAASTADKTYDASTSAMAVTSLTGEEKGTQLFFS
jgi:hypothetical protein